MEPARLPSELLLWPLSEVSEMEAGFKLAGRDGK
jgi:hypothetical protein